MNSRKVTPTIALLTLCMGQAPKPSAAAPNVSSTPVKTCFDEGLAMLAHAHKLGHKPLILETHLDKHVGTTDLQTALGSSTSLKFNGSTTIYPDDLKDRDIRENCTADPDGTTVQTRAFEKALSGTEVRFPSQIYFGTGALSATIIIRPASP